MLDRTRRAVKFIALETALAFLETTAESVREALEVETPAQVRQPARPLAPKGPVKGPVKGAHGNVFVIAGNDNPERVAERTLRAAALKDSIARHPSTRPRP